MENKINKLLLRQINRHFGSINNLPEELNGFIKDINNTYSDFDEDTKLLQNSIEISSQELRNAYQKHKSDAETQKETINKIKEAIFVLNPSLEGGSNKKESDTIDTGDLFDSLIKLIEEHKRAEEDILKLSKAVEQNPASIVITDLNGDIEYVNTKFCTITGYTKEESIGKNPRILKTETTSSEYAVNLWQTILSGKEWRGELQNKKKNGDLYWESALIAPIINENQQIIHFIAIKEDITERKLAEEERLKQNGLLTSLLDSIPDIIFFKDINGAYLGCNPSFVEFVGKTKNEIIGKTDHNLFGKEIADEFRRYDLEMLKHKISHHNEEWITYPDGRKVLLDTLKTPYWASDGSLIGILGISRDITKRKEGEEALLQSSMKFEAIISASPDGIGMASIDGKIQLMSEKLALMHGYTVEEINENLKKSIFDFVDSSDHQKLKENISKLLGGVRLNKISEYLAVKKDNTRFYTDINSSILLDSDGKPASILFVERDITERKLAEEKLRWNQSLLQHMSNSSPLGFLVVDNRTDKILYSNERFCQIWGIQHLAEKISKGEMKNNDIIPYCLPVLADVPAFAESCTPLQEENNRIVLEDDIAFIDNRTIHRFTTQIRGENDEYYGRFYIFEDITERKKAEKELIHLSTRLALATRVGGVGVWEFDIANNVLIWDDQMFELYNIEKTNLKNVYQIWQQSIYNEDLERTNTEIQLAIKGDKEFDTEFRIVYPDESIHNIRALATVQRDETGKPLRMIGTNWDITTQKLSEENLLNYTKQIELKNFELDMALSGAESATIHAEEMAKQAEMANKSKSIFLANMSHEIRTPLNAIIGFSQLLNRDHLLNKVQREYLLSIIRAGEHLLTLINEILELSKIEAGKVVLNPTHVDLHELIEDIHIIFKESARFNHLHFIFEMANDLPRYVIVDENKLRQVFVNLIGNAIKFTDEGGVAVRVGFEKINEDTFKLIVEVQDSGSGIDETEIENLFKHFMQTSSGIKKGSGTGLGLALSRELVLLMGGDITVTSKVGEGSVFKFFIDIKEGNVKAIDKEINKRVICIESGQKEFKILVVDDKEENLQVAVNLLKIVGFSTNEAVNGLDAIEKFERWMPDLILMDMRMPVMDGYEAISIIKSTEKGKQTPIIAVTASSFEEEKQKTQLLDLQGYIRKPFRENELLNAIGKILNIIYIYEEDFSESINRYIENEDAIFSDIEKLSKDIINSMSDAISVADFDLLLKIINEVSLYNNELALQLTKLAQNYDYDYLQKILKNEK